MSDLSLSEWRVFLRARVLQEQGKDVEALRTFDELAAAHPGDPHIVASRAYALERLGRQDEAIASRIAAKYSALGRSLVGDADDPKVWTDRLKSLSNEIETFESGGKLASAMMAW